jgi:hypothetical protein
VEHDSLIPASSRGKSQKLNRVRSTREEFEAAVDESS